MMIPLTLMDATLRKLQLTFIFKYFSRFESGETSWNQFYLHICSVVLVKSLQFLD